MIRVAAVFLLFLAGCGAFPSFLLTHADPCVYQSPQRIDEILESVRRFQQAGGTRGEALDAILDPEFDDVYDRIVDRCFLWAIDTIYGPD